MKLLCCHILDRRCWFLACTSTLRTTYCISDHEDTPEAFTKQLVNVFDWTVIDACAADFPRRAVALPVMYISSMCSMWDCEWIQCCTAGFAKSIIHIYTFCGPLHAHIWASIITTMLTDKHSFSLHTQARWYAPRRCKSLACAQFRTCQYLWIENVCFIILEHKHMLYLQ